MKLLITGASGYLGRHLAPRAVASGHEVFATYAASPERVTAGEPVCLDLRDPAAGDLVRELCPDAVLHTAVVNMNGPEDNMLPVNAEGTRALTTAAAESGARFVYMSTDVVHDGRAAPYGDDVEPTPLGAYPRSKAAGEHAVLEVLPGAAIVRTSLIYGLDEIDHGTAGFLERLERGEPLRLFADVLRQPVWVETLAEALLRLAANDVHGFVNVAGSQVLSRDAFGRRMLAYWGHDDEARIESISARELGLRVPYDLRLRLERAREVLGMSLPGVDEVLNGAAR